MKRDYMDDLRQYPLITALSAITTMAIVVSPFGLLCWWMGWFASVEKDEGGRDMVDRALSNAMLEGWREGENVKDR